MTFREKLIKLRTKRDLSVRQLSKESGISYHTLVALERKDNVSNRITIGVLIKLSKFFKISLDEMVKGIDEFKV